MYFSFELGGSGSGLVPSWAFLSYIRPENMLRTFSSLRHSLLSTAEVLKCKTKSATGAPPIHQNESIKYKLRLYAK